MPRGDRTGPNGNGPMTGRRLGFCTGNDSPGFEMTPGGFFDRGGRAYGRGFGYGRGMGYRHGQQYGRYADEIVPEVSQETLLGGGGKGRNKGGALGTGGFCVCAKCGEKIPHQQGEKCTTIKCPACGHTMIREELLKK